MTWQSNMQSSMVYKGVHEKCAQVNWRKTSNQNYPNKVHWKPTTRVETCTYCLNFYNLFLINYVKIMGAYIGLRINNSNTKRPGFLRVDKKYFPLSVAACLQSDLPATYQSSLYSESGSGRSTTEDTSINVGWLSRGTDG